MIPDNYTATLVLAITIAAVPLFLSIVTSYLKVSIVLSLLRTGIGTQQVPGSVTIMALSLMITFLIMKPVVSEMVLGAEKLEIRSLKVESISDIKKITPVLEPLADFLQKHSGQLELTTLASLNAQRRKVGPEGSNWIDLVGAFMLTELREAFAMGFALLIPFLVIDIVVANLLVGMGLTMLTPTLISLPVKLLVFGFSDTWLRLTEALVTSYGDV